MHGSPAEGRARGPLSGASPGVQKGEPCGGAGLSPCCPGPASGTPPGAVTGGPSRPPPPSPPGEAALTHTEGCLFFVRRGIVASILVFLCFGVTQAKDGPFSRPHPGNSPFRVVCVPARAFLLCVAALAVLCAALRALPARAAPRPLLWHRRRVKGAPVLPARAPPPSCPRCLQGGPGPSRGATWLRGSRALGVRRPPAWRRCPGHLVCPVPEAGGVLTARAPPVHVGGSGSLGTNTFPFLSEGVYLL